SNKKKERTQIASRYILPSYQTKQKMSSSSPLVSSRSVSSVPVSACTDMPTLDRLKCLYISGLTYAEQHAQALNPVDHHAIQTLKTLAAQATSLSKLGSVALLGLR